MSGDELRIFAPDDMPSRSHRELAQRAKHAEQERDQERERAARFAERLREMGIDPETMGHGGPGGGQD
jgi:hypothetical protein